MTSVLAKEIENKGYLDVRADENIFYADLYDAEWAFADDVEMVELAIELPLWAWRKWFFTDQTGTGMPVFICFSRR